MRMPDNNIGLLYRKASLGGQECMQLHDYSIARAFLEQHQFMRGSIQDQMTLECW